MFHPHIHCIVPGGGLSSAGRWVNSRKKFFLPVKVLSRKLKGKFLHYLKSAELEFHGSQKYLQDAGNFQRLLDSFYKKDWVVYCKPPFKDAACVVEYFGRYTHCAAISNNRILKLENGMVSFKWRDYKDKNRWKVMTVSAEEFIRRFLIHILPPGFMKIRHYGLLGNRNKTKKLTVCKRLTHTPIVSKGKASTLKLIRKLIGRDIARCPACGCGRLQHYLGISPPISA